jgi:hypothetical protein
MPTKRTRRAASSRPARAAAPAKRRQKPAAVPPVPNEFEEWQAKLTPRERRIDAIVGMMSQGQWFSGASHRALAKEWGIHPGTVEHLAAEANRLLRFVFRSDEESQKDLRARTLQNFEVIRVKALVAGSPAALRVSLDANETLARYLGFEPPKRVQVTQGDEIENLTDEQLDAVANEGAVALQRIAGAGAAAAAAADEQG